MREALLVGSKVFYNGKWEYKMDPDDNYYMDEEAYNAQQLQSSDNDPPVYICYDGKHVVSYTYNELFVACKQDRGITDFIFDHLAGEVPEDLLDDYISEGTIIQCPHCNKYITREDDGRWDYI